MKAIDKRKNSPNYFGFLIVSLVLLYGNCQQTPTPVDIGIIPWIVEYSYQPSEVFRTLSDAGVTGPRIPLTCGQETHYLQIDLLSFGIILRDNAFEVLDFEPQRLATVIQGNREMLLEEGFLHRVEFLGQNYELLYAALLKRTNQPFKAKGSIGRNYFLDGHLTLDLLNQVLAYSDRPFANPPNTGISCTLANELDPRGGLIKFHGTANKEPVLMTLSTTHTLCQLSPEYVALQGLNPDNHYLTLDTLQIGQWRFTDVRCILKEDQLMLEPESPEPIFLTVGLNMLKPYLLTIDFQQQVLYLAPNHKIEPPKTEQPKDSKAERS
jgi:hypothetical protein